MLERASDLNAVHRNLPNSHALELTPLRAPRSAPHFPMTVIVGQRIMTDLQSFGAQSPSRKTNRTHRMMFSQFRGCTVVARNNVTIDQFSRSTSKLLIVLLPLVSPVGIEPTTY